MLIDYTNSPFFWPSLWPDKYVNVLVSTNLSTWGGSEYSLVEFWFSHWVHPESNAVNLRAQADGTTNLIALVELLSSESHGEPLPVLVKQCQIVLHQFSSSTPTSCSLCLPRSPTSAWCPAWTGGSSSCITVSMEAWVRVSWSTRSVTQLYWTHQWS